MNILVPITWLKDFLKTEASAEKIAEVLSLCSQSVEKIHKVDNDQVLEIEITVNRYDCLSIIGIAKEAGAILPQFGIKAKFVEPKIPLIPKLNQKKEENHLKVEIQDPTICPRFSAILIDNVTVKPSPLWLSERLEKVKIRSINNVVDISNYLMIETGQPIHTFDFDKILGQKMIMRLSKKGESVTTLDGIKRVLKGDDIVIEDGKGRLIDLCGIMGGQNSEIDQKTKKVLFFVQAYDPVRVRKTSMSLGLRTEAAARFERGIDLEGIIPVVSQGVKMMEELTGGKVGGKLIDIYPSKQKTSKIKVEFNFIKDRLGENINHKQIFKILSALGFKINSSNKQSLLLRNKNDFMVDVPTWRAKDINIPEDILEEVARVYGYFRLPSNIPQLDPGFGLKEEVKPEKGVVGSVFKWEWEIKNFLKSVGFTETYNFSFISKDLIKNCLINEKDHLKLTNPLTSDLEYLRVSLIPSLLNVFSKNETNFPQMSIFEMANIYLPKEKDLPEEKMNLTGLTNSKDFYQVKGIVIEILKELGIFSVEIKPISEDSAEPFWQDKATAKVFSDRKMLGTIGQISKEVSSSFLLNNQNLICFDLDMGVISQLASDRKSYIPIPKFPPIIEDLCFTFPDKTPIGEVIQSIKKVSPLIRNLELIDSFKQSRTFRITYQDPERSLNDKEVGKIREKIIQLINKKIGATLKTQS